MLRQPLRREAGGKDRKGQKAAGHDLHSDWIIFFRSRVKVLTTFGQSRPRRAHSYKPSLANMKGEDRGSRIEDRRYRFQEEVLLFPTPEGHRILAGGETTGTGCNWSSRPGSAPDRSSGLSPLQGWKSFGADVPVVSPPANILQRPRRGRTFS